MCIRDRVYRMKRGKKYVEAAKTIDRGTLYDVADAVSLVKKTATAKFDETIEAPYRKIDHSDPENPRVTDEVDQTDVRSLRRLDRTHSSIVGIMYISNLESGTVS